MAFIDSNHILYKSQYGFRKISTSLAIIELNHFASDVVIIQISLIGGNGGNRCLCRPNVYAGGAQRNHSVETQRNSVTVEDFRSDVVISYC